MTKYIIDNSTPWAGWSCEDSMLSFEPSKKAIYIAQMNNWAKNRFRKRYQLFVLKSVIYFLPIISLGLLWLM